MKIVSWKAEHIFSSVHANDTLLQDNEMQETKANILNYYQCIYFCTSSNVGAFPATKICLKSSWTVFCSILLLFYYFHIAPGHGCKVQEETGWGVYVCGTYSIVPLHTNVSHGSWWTPSWRDDTVLALTALSQVLWLDGIERRWCGWIFIVGCGGRTIGGIEGVIGVITEDWQ